MRTFTVLDAGPRALIQDLGRSGYAALGVPPSGALDATALRLANRLVGNPETSAGVELLFGGFSLRANTSCTAAVTGACAPISAGGRTRDSCAPIHLADGDLLTVDTASAGTYCYLAVSGGIAVTPQLGSAATDTLSGIGPPPLRVGDVVRLGPRNGLPSGADMAGARQSAGESHVGMAGSGQSAGEIQVDVVLGPRDDWFSDAAAQLRAGSWEVSAECDRIGVRLRGTALRRRNSRELPSEPILTGAIQVPAGGAPLIFLADHPTTGGYPVIAVVAPHHLSALAQARPGTRIRFNIRKN